MRLAPWTVLVVCLVALAPAQTIFTPKTVSPEQALDKDLAFLLDAYAMKDREARNRAIAAMNAGVPEPQQYIIWQEIGREDAASTAFMKETVARIGWPTITRVGNEGADNAWLLVQHADRDRPFQAHCLKLMEPLLVKGEVDPKNFAYLYDRVAIGTGKKQRYGTQATSRGNQWVISDLENPAKVDEYRRQVGLGPLKDYLDLIRRMYRQG